MIGLQRPGPRPVDPAVLTIDEAAGQQAVAQVLRRSHRIVSWYERIPGIDFGLVVHTPWARVVVARTGFESLRWPEDYLAGRGAGLALQEALNKQYPRVLTTWASEEELLDQHLPSKALRNFLTWSLGRGGEAAAWSTGPAGAVRGAWASWPDAVLVESRAGDESVFHVRAAPWFQE